MTWKLHQSQSTPSPRRARRGSRIHLAVRADRDPADPAGRLRDPGPVGRRQPHPARQQPRRGPLERRDLALIALGYTLVYGIIELINFAHGEVFMLGSFDRGGALLARSGSTPATGTGGLVVGLLAILVLVDAGQRLAQRDDRARRLPAVTQRAEAGAADHGGRHVVHPAERRHPLDRRLAEERARPDRLAEGAVQHRRRARSRAGPCSRSA